MVLTAETLAAVDLPATSSGSGSSEPGRAIAPAPQPDPRTAEVLRQLIAQPVVDADAKVAAVRAIYDELEIRPQTEALINSYFQDALQHLERVAAPVARKEPLRHLALQLMDRES